MSGEPKKMKRKAYEEELARLEIELVRMQEWVKQEGQRVVIVFEGRDSAGKGGTIKRITRRLNPRTARVVALAAPTDREKTQMYLQRYIAQLPAAGEIVLFDRSWYNRLGVEKVMGFCTDQQYTDFLQQCPVFERQLIDDGIILLKYWLEISDETQEDRFRQRATDPRRRWKLSPMDVASWNKWVDYSRARDTMFQFTDTVHSPWNIVDANIKRHARLNVIRDILDKIPYEAVTHDDIEFPPRPDKGDYVRPDYSHRTFVKDWYG